jgi:hypothetical protein
VSFPHVFFPKVMVLPVSPITQFTFLSSDSTPSDRYISSYPPLHSITKTAAASNPLQNFRIDDSIPQIKNAAVLEARTQLSEDPTASFNSTDAKSPSTMSLALIDATYPPLLCPSCKHLASSRTEADYHYRSTHHGERDFVCMHPYCQRTYRSKGGLKYHLEQMHTISHIPEHSGATASLPPIVHRPPSIPSPRVKHSAPHTHAMTMKPRPTSSHDSKSSAGKRERKRPKPTLLPASEHLLNSAYDPLVCPVCRATFKRKTNVINHLVDSHHGEEPYHCIITGCTHPKAYATREGLVYHIANHHDREASGNDSSSR